MRDSDRVKKLAGILNEEMDKGDMHDALGDAMIALQDAGSKVKAVSDEIESTLYTDESVEELNDLKELKTLAGIADPIAPKVDLDAIIKRGKENQLIGKYRPPGSPRDPELDDILRRRAKELEPDPRIGRGIELDEIKNRIDRFKSRPDLQQFQFGKIK